MATPDMEIRKLQSGELYELARILDQSDSWKKLMAIIPNPTNESQCLFDNDHLTMIEQAIRKQQRSGAEIFLSEWGSLGKKRPTCNLMLNLLVKAQLFRAADYLAVNILKVNAPERPKFGPAATIDVSDKVLEELLKQQAADLHDSNPSEQPLSWSLHFAEKPVNLMTATCRDEKPDDRKKQSDLMKFTDKSDLIKFSATEIDDVKSLPQQVSDMMKFSDVAITEKSEEDFVLQEARSEDIPLCVRDNAFQAIRTDSIISQDTKTETTIDSTDISESTMESEQVILPSVSENVIPVVVLEYNEKDSDKSAH